jgi:hypothetical protein
MITLTESEGDRGNGASKKAKTERKEGTGIARLESNGGGNRYWCD